MTDDVKVYRNRDNSAMVVRNISLTGIGFVTLKAHNLKKDDEVTVEFTLDDKRRSRIVKNFIVRRITKNNYVGCESYKPPHADEAPDQADKAIGFYLML